VAGLVGGAPVFIGSIVGYTSRRSAQLPFYGIATDLIVVYGGG
jgi:hypothetical protein